jgi:uncharacterized repeat protein (TIGR03803 family)
MPAAPVINILVSFSFGNGANPYEGLMADANGNLFGTTMQGGSDGKGAVFEIVNHGTTAAPNYDMAATTLYSFNGTTGDGANPYAGLMADANGDLFGTTLHGGSDGYGTVFELVNHGTAAAPNYDSGATTLYSFFGQETGDGANPFAGLMADANGNLFGTTLGGGSDGSGTVFEIVNHGTAAAPNYDSGATTLYSFTGATGDGANPYGGLIDDANGNLFGTTGSGGSDGYGTVFEIVNHGTAAAPNYDSGATTLYSFTGASGDGANPYAGLIADAKGNLFGTTGYGGSDGYGTVFEIVNHGAAAAPNYDTAATTLYSFTGATGDGANPYAGLMADANGNLLGTTIYGGSDDLGTVFELKDSGYVICFMCDTLIRTPDGEAAIETLKRGDLVLTADGKAMPVAWLGRQTVSTRFADPLRVLPIRVKAGALGENVPCRDLLVSPCHALLVDDVLIQAGALVNGTSVLRETVVPRVFVYYHVELDDHSLILAENTPAETFVDNVERLAFDNWAEHEALYPDGKPIEEMPYPRAKGRRQVPMRIRATVDERAKALGVVEISAVA